MPTYVYECEVCGFQYEAERRVDERDIPAWCDDCEELSVRRVFTPTGNLMVPAFFKIDAGWMLPDREDKAAWENMERSSTAHAPKQRTFKQEFEENWRKAGGTLTGA